MEHKLHYLYKVTNQIDGKIYIGQTVQNPECRWQKHKSDANRSPKTAFHAAIRKYGSSNFIIETIATCRSFDDANMLETLLIHQYNAYIKNGRGYNATFGGKNSSKKERIVYYSDEYREMCSKRAIGKKPSQDTIKKRIESILETVRVRNEQDIKDGKLKCHAPNCYVIGPGYRYKWYNGVRYCQCHGSRLQRHGSFDQKKPTARQGQKSPKKIEFSDEQIASIMADTRPAHEIAIDYKVGKTKIYSVRRENRLQK
jgi:group I intron endonuclease